MCQCAWDVGLDRKIGSLGDMRAITPDIVWWDKGPEGDGSDQGDEFCLCWVDIPRTLIDAGYKVWRNPDVIPEYFCERVEEDPA